MVYEDAARPASFLGRQFREDDIQRLINDVREDIDATLTSQDPVDVIRGLADRWQRMVRITIPRASMLGLDELVSTVAPRAIPDWTPPRPRTRARDRRTAIAIAWQSLDEVLRQAPKAVRVQRNVTVRRASAKTTDWSSDLPMGLLGGA